MFSNEEMSNMYAQLQEHEDIRDVRMLVEFMKMKKSINEIARGSSGWLSDKNKLDFSPVGSMAKQILDQGRYQNWTGEQTMLVLAYTALTKLEDMTKREIERLELSTERMLYPRDSRV